MLFACSLWSVLAVSSSIYWEMSHSPKNTYYLFRNNISLVEQRIKKFFVLDFEATCNYTKRPRPQEIIEFPCLAVNGLNFKIESQFQRYVRPKWHPQLTTFCTNLTGIQQEQVENEPEFPVVFADFLKWQKECSENIPENETMFVTSGNWDLQFMLPRQCRQRHLRVPSLMQRWINIKTSFFQATGYYPRGINDMFSYMNESIVGRLHSGIDDCHSIYKVLVFLADRGLIFQETDTYSKTNKNKTIY